MEQRPEGLARVNGKRRFTLAVLTLAFIAAGAGWAWWWHTVGQYRESTDNAYVAGNLVQVTSQVAGTVVEIRADDTDRVREGDRLALLDDADATIALERARAELAEAVRQVRQLEERRAQTAAAIALRETELARAQSDLARRSSAIGDGSISREELEHARSAVSLARSALELAHHEARAAAALVDGTSIARHPSVARARARVREATLALARASLPSPVTGHIARRSVQVGQRITPGMPLMAIVPSNEMWVDANFKEGQLRHLRIGQSAEVRSDLYGDEVIYPGRVIGLGMGTGSAFSLLPPQNATGNWIKVVQRVPVRVALDPAQLEKHPLRIGLSLQVTVDTHQRGGAVLASAGPRERPAYATPVFRNAAAEADRLSDAIIRDNAAPVAGRSNAPGR